MSLSESSLKKAVLARIKAEGNSPHRAAEKMGVSAFLLVMFAHGYSRPQKGTFEKLEKGLNGKAKTKTIKKAARKAKSRG